MAKKATATETATEPAEAPASVSPPKIISPLDALNMSIIRSPVRASVPPD
jgi:hypothetical protein